MPYNGMPLGVLDTRYLRLDASNDPVTAGLEVNAATAGEPVLILQTTDDNAANNIQEWQSSAGAPLSYVNNIGDLTIPSLLTISASNAPPAITAIGRDPGFIQHAYRPLGGDFALAYSLFKCEAENDTVAIDVATVGVLVILNQGGVPTISSFFIAVPPSAAPWNDLHFVMNSQQRIGIGTGTMTGRLNVDQSSASGAIPVLALDQADASEEFIDFISAVGAGNPVDTVTAVGAPYARLRVAVNGTFKYIQLYDA